MQYYHNLITEKSFTELQKLKQKYQFVLIGGWAVFLYARALKSKDIDVVVDYETLAKLKERYGVVKNDRLKKYEVKFDEIDIDIYLPHYSEIGIKAEEITKKIVSRKGFTLPELEVLFLLKLYAWQQRRGSAKGKKDELDIFSLAFLPEFNWRKYLTLIAEYNFKKYHQNFLELLQTTRSIKEIAANEQQLAKIKKRIFRRF